MRVQNNQSVPWECRRTGCKARLHAPPVRIPYGQLPERKHIFIPKHAPLEFRETVADVLPKLRKECSPTAEAGRRRDQIDVPCFWQNRTSESAGMGNVQRVVVTVNAVLLAKAAMKCHIVAMFVEGGFDPCELERRLDHAGMNYDFALFQF